MSDHGKKHEADGGGTVLYGLLAEYDGPEALVHAAERVREAGYSKWDAFTPFPIHALEEAMKIKRTILPWFVFFAGITGLAAGILLQWWTNAVDYPFMISGKPMWSIPANVPIMFEVTVLFSALTAAGAMFVMNNLPQLWHPLFGSPRFRKVTSDGFYIAIESRDSKFNEKAATDLLKGTHPLHFERVEEPARPNRAIPKPVIAVALMGASLTLIPVAWTAKMRSTTHKQPMTHWAKDMDYQPKFLPQAENPLFADGRAMRSPVQGTVARGEILDNPALLTGTVGGAWVTDFPPEVVISDATMRHGKAKFRVFCSTCHGLGGKGDGMIAQRAAALQTPGWVPPANLQSDLVRNQPIGQIFNTITNGIRSMPAWGHSLSPEDRWAVALYVRALGRSSNAAIDDVPPAQRSALN